MVHEIPPEVSTTGAAAASARRHAGRQHARSACHNDNTPACTSRVGSALVGPRGPRKETHRSRQSIRPGSKGELPGRDVDAAHADR
jgi:hypothetical protein